MTALASLVDANCHQLESLARVIGALDRDRYAGTGGLPVASGPGGHVRHVLDAYDCLLGGVASGRVDMTARQRDERTAADPSVACARIRRTLGQLDALRTSADGPLAVHAEDVAGARVCASSLARELASVLSHTIHHLALVALVLRLRGVEPGEDFGVAPSTLAYWKKAS